MWKAESLDGFHPEFRKTRILLVEALGIQDSGRVIVFIGSHGTVEALMEFLLENFSARRFVGQGNREGLDGITQNERQETPNKF